MKKSKFVKSSKDLFSRGFNPSKCTTALKLAGARLKILRNMKEAQVKQMKQEIAQLLQSGQDRTARIRVDHVVMEEKMMAAYDLIEIYCELIVARMQIIESQKICPIDLKEAIASVVFASPVCGDVLELRDVKKHLTEKYGKDFITAAAELRPECGVGRLLVEKLSANASDVQTKIKILSAIAKEHNIKWDPESFEAKNVIPPNDLLNGPRTFEEAKLHASLPYSGSCQNNRTNYSSWDVSQLDRRPSLGQHKQNLGFNSEFHHEASSLGDERAQLCQGDYPTSPMDRHQCHWNMEFRDATSAAKAAAESAELASMAARAAAVLSIRDRVTRLQNERLDRMKTSNMKIDENSEHSYTKEYSQSTSVRSKPSMHDYSLQHDFSVVDKHEHPMGMHRQSLNKKAESAENTEEDRMRKQPGSKYFHQHSHVSDNKNVFSNYEGVNIKSASENPFSGFGKEGFYGDANKISSLESAAVVFDKSDSESEIHDFSLHPAYDEQKPGFHLQSSSGHHSWSRRSSSSKGNSTSFQLFTRKKSEKLGDSMPVVFDEDMNVSRHTGTEYQLNQPVKSYSNEKFKLPLGFDKNQPSSSSDDEQKSKEIKIQGKEPEAKFTWRKQAPGNRNCDMEFSDVTNSSPEGGEALNLKKLKSSSVSERKQGSAKISRVKQRITPDWHIEEEESLRKSSGDKQKFYIVEARKELKMKGSLATSLSDEQTQNSRGISQRRRAACSSFGKISNDKVEGESTTYETPDRDNLCSKMDSYDHPKPVKLNLWGPYASCATMQETKILNKSVSLDVRQHHSLQRKYSQVGNSNKPTIVGSNERPSHVHPKLPEYDMLVQAFRKNRS